MMKTFKEFKLLKEEIGFNYPGKEDDDKKPKAKKKKKNPFGMFSSMIGPLLPMIKEVAAEAFVAGKMGKDFEDWWNNEYVRKLKNDLDVDQTSENDINSENWEEDEQELGYKIKPKKDDQKINN